MHHDATSASQGHILPSELTSYSAPPFAGAGPPMFSRQRFHRHRQALIKYILVAAAPAPTPDPVMAKKAKSRLINVRLISMAMTGFFYTFKRPRTSSMMGMLKYDPIIRKKVLFLETRRKSK
ncbi:hypothetical protein XA68_10692 [Ophiocordyceps unilateralis]|uniref:Large ribosomal subunit protein bL33m n=1 Tax=Ophiocordyceps unilateralis TaxID=268505 RepID=A0A2A9PHU0_OPHUN|nr:hypothetical protein XA68_10692 [Ophiocordyceps unilateralis]